MATQGSQLIPTTLTAQAKALLTLLVEPIPAMGAGDGLHSIPTQEAITAVGDELTLRSTLETLLNVRAKLSTSVEGSPAPVLRTAWSDGGNLIYGIDEALVVHFRSLGDVACDLFRYDFSASAQ